MHRIQYIVRFSRPVVVVFLLFAMFSFAIPASRVSNALPNSTLKNAVTATSFVVQPLQGISIDAGRIAFETIGPPGTLMVYDVNSGSSVSLPTTGLGNPSFGPFIYSNKVVAFHSSDGYYCLLSNAPALTPCSNWTVIHPSNSNSTCGTLGHCLDLNPGRAGPAVGGDMIAWAYNRTATSRLYLLYYRFSTNAITNVTFPVAPMESIGSLSTDGRVIVFTSGYLGSPMTMKYYDTTVPTPSLVNTGLLTASVANSGNIIAFDAAAGGLHSYDILRSQENAPPLYLYFGESYFNGRNSLINYQGGESVNDGPVIDANRIVAMTDTTTLNYDCTGRGIGSGDVCLQYWNFQGPSYVAPLLRPDASPALNNTNGYFGSVAINNGVIAFVGLRGTLQYVPVPMKGDVNQDGVIDIFDLSLVGGCYGSRFNAGTC